MVFVSEVAKRKGLGMGQEKRGPLQWRQHGPETRWVKEYQGLEGAAVIKVTKSSFSHLTQTCRLVDQKVRK